MFDRFADLPQPAPAAPAARLLLGLIGLLAALFLLAASAPPPAVTPPPAVAADTGCPLTPASLLARFGRLPAPACRDRPALSPGSAPGCCWLRVGRNRVSL